MGVTELGRPADLQDARVGIQPDVDVGPDRVPNRSHPSFRLTEHPVPWLQVKVVGQRPHLEGCVPVGLNQFPGVIRQFIGRIPSHGLIDAHLVPAFAPNQPVHRQPGRFAGNVPQGVLDATDGGVQHHPTREARSRVHQVPQLLHVPRIPTHQPLLEIANHLDGAQIGSGGIRLSEPRDALVGVDLDEGNVAVAHVDNVGGDVGYLHGYLPYEGTRVGIQYAARRREFRMDNPANFRRRPFFGHPSHLSQ